MKQANLPYINLNLLVRGKNLALQLVEDFRPRFFQSSALREIFQSVLSKNVDDVVNVLKQEDRAPEKIFPSGEEVPIQGQLYRADRAFAQEIMYLPQKDTDSLEPVPVALEGNATSFFFSLQSSATVDGSTFQDEDIVFFDGTSQSFSTWFDGSDVGLGSLEIAAFDIISDKEILLSFTAPTTIAGIAVDDSDVVRFTASELGETTVGSFDLWFDGSDVGLTTSGEDVDGIQLLDDGSVLISTHGTANVPGLSGIQDEDILRFDPTSLGSGTAGSWSVYFDGSDVGLANSSSEDVKAIALDPDNNNLHLSTVGNFSVPGIAGADEDVVVFTPTSTGPNTSGNFEPVLFFDGSGVGIGGDIRGLDLAIGFGGAPEPLTNTPPVANDDSFTLDADTTFTSSAPGVLANDSDADGNSLSVSLLSTVSNGSLTLNDNGSFSYTPTPGFRGTDSFTYAASDGTATDNAAVTLTVNAPLPPPPTSQFNIEVNFIDNSLTGSQQAVFTDAANRWAEIIVEDIPDVFVSGIGLIDDVFIDASAPIIDGVGGILGRAGPTRIRSRSFLPATGVMEFDSADLANLQASGRLEDVILHEMGHVLGIGAIWDFFPDLLTGAGSADPRFTGAQATAEYNSIFDLNDSSVPVANTGGPGTRDSHWRESVFDNELMTGFLDSGRENPISRVTIGSLADVGYGVNLQAADPYIPPSSLVASNLSPGTSSGTSSGTGLSGFLSTDNHFSNEPEEDHFMLRPNPILV